MAAGADVGFVEAPVSLEEVRAIPHMVKGPCLLNVVPGGKTPLMSARDAQSYGFRMVVMPGAALVASLTAVDLAMKELVRTGESNTMLAGETIQTMFARLGAEEWSQLQRSLVQ